jgi:hypothetical protein
MCTKTNSGKGIKATNFSLMDLVDRFIDWGTNNNWYYWAIRTVTVYRSNKSALDAIHGISMS